MSVCIKGGIVCVSACLWLCECECADTRYPCVCMGMSVGMCLSMRLLGLCVDSN